MKTNRQPADVRDRTRGLGGSDAAAILGLSPWKTPLDVYYETIGEKEPDDLEHNSRVEWGILHEDAIAAKYSRETGRRVRKVNTTLHHPRYPFLTAHIDRDVVRGVDPVKRVLEIKTAYPESREQREKWGEPGTDELPDYYLCQVLHYLAVTGADVCDVATLINGHDFRVYHVGRDEQLIGAIEEREREFYETHIVPRIPPEPTTVDDCKMLWPENRGEVIVADEETTKLLVEFELLKQRMSDDEGREKELKTAIAKAIQDRDAITNDYGKPLVTYKAQSRSGFDSKALLAAHPEFAQTYATSTRFRTLRRSPALKALAKTLTPSQETV